MKTCIIIGGGIGGLVSGALLAKEGYKVTVLEKNAIIGGGLQTFKRHGVSFPTGMHIFGGFHEGENLRKLFEYLGVMDKISLRPMDEDASDVVTVMGEGKTYNLPRGRERYMFRNAKVIKDFLQVSVFRKTAEDMHPRRETHPMPLEGLQAASYDGVFL